MRSETRSLSSAPSRVSWPRQAPRQNPNDHPASWTITEGEEAVVPSAWQPPRRTAVEQTKPERNFRMDGI